MRLPLFAALPFMMLAPGFAGRAEALEDSELRPLGFSADARYYAIAQVGESDGSGYPYAAVTIIDTSNNSVVAHEATTIEQEATSATSAKVLAMAIKAARIGKYGISPSKIPGTDLLRRLPTDKSTYADSIFSTEAHAGFVSREQLVIETAPWKAAPERCTDPDGSGRGAQLLRVTMKDLDVEGGSVILNDDSALPKSRECAFDYKVVGVTSHRSSLVITLQFTMPGYEGLDHRYMVVGVKRH